MASRRQQARDILDNPLFKELKDKAITARFEAWVQSGLNDSEEREEIFRQIKAIEFMHEELIATLMET